MNFLSRPMLAGLLLGASVLSGQAVGATSVASNARSTHSVYSPGSQYTATLDQSRNQWRLQPLAGQDVVIQTGSCATGAMVPPGVWLLVLDGQGRPELVAPSVTRLPAGVKDRIELRACDRAQGKQIAVPQSVLDMLAANTGAVYVDD